MSLKITLGRTALRRLKKAATNSCSTDRFVHTECMRWGFVVAV